MANHPSAEKRHRQSLKRCSRNRAVQVRVRSAIKTARESIASGDKKVASEAVRKAESEIRKGKSRGTYKPRTADRLASRLARALWRM